MSEKAKSASEFFDKLNAEQKAATIPYYVHEGEMFRMERTVKRWFIVALVIFIALIATNAGWIYYESQFETIVVTQDVDTGEAPAIVSATGDAIYGQSEANRESTSP